MEWVAMRAHFERLFSDAKKRGETQETVAARGGIRQNQISKMLDNDNLGPQVETFARAVEGLGLTVSSFFAQIEGLKTGAGSTENATPLAGQAEHATAPASTLASPSIDLAPFEAFGSALGKSLGQQLAGTNRKRKDTPRPRKKSGGSSHDRGDARRRA